jgi:hypothetical protein
VKQLATAMTTLWRRDFEIRDVLMRSGGLWVALIFRLEPVRVRVSSLRDYLR